MIKLQFINDIFHNLFDNDLSTFVWTGKFIGVIIFMLTIGKEMFKSFASSGHTFSQDKEGFTPYTLVRGLILLAVIISCTQILSMADNILLGIEKIGEAKWNADLQPLSLYTVQIDPPNTGNTTWDMVVQYLREINENLSPLAWINKLLYILFWVFDLLLFTIFVAKRFFYMGLIKIFAPIIIGLSILPEYRDMSYNLGKVYIRNFLVIIPYILVSVFANRLHDGFISYLYNAGNGHVAGSVAMSVTTQTFRSGALFGTVILKLMLYKGVSNFMKEIIS